MIRKVYEVDLMIRPKCGGTMKVVTFITDYAPVDRIIFESCQARSSISSLP